MSGLINEIFSNGYELSLITEKVNLSSLITFIHLKLKENYEGSFFLFTYVNGINQEGNFEQDMHKRSTINSIVRNPNFLKALIGDGIEGYKVTLSSSLIKESFNKRALYLNFKLKKNLNTSIYDDENNDEDYSDMPALVPIGFNEKVHNS